jgi:hypothetical protein
MPLPRNRNVMHRIKFRAFGFSQAFGGTTCIPPVDNLGIRRDQANPGGRHELRYQDEEAQMSDAIRRTLKIIRERDGA